MGGKYQVQMYIFKEGSIYHHLAQNYYIAIPTKRQTYINSVYAYSTIVGGTLWLEILAQISLGVFS